MTSVEVVQLLLDHVSSKHGMPRTFILDRDKLFKSNYFKEITRALKIKLHMATKGHPQTDGQSENMIRTLSAMIRSTVQKNPKNWDYMLSELEFHYNAAPNKGTGITPFEVDLGRIPESELTRKFPRSDTVCPAAVNCLDRRLAFCETARDNMANAIAQQTFYANKKRKHV